MATTCVGGRAVVELLAHLGDDERELVWPVAVAESPDDRSVVFRTYCSQYPVSIAAYTGSPNPPIRSASVVNPARAGR